VKTMHKSARDERYAARQRRLVWLRNNFLEQARLAREAGFLAQETRMLRNAADYDARIDR